MRSILLRGTIIVSLLLTFASCTTTPQSAGIKPLEPKNGGKAANLQPMLKWAPAENHDGTYDLVIFESIKDDQLGRKRAFGRGLFSRRPSRGGIILQKLYMLRKVLGSYEVESTKDE